MIDMCFIEKKLECPKNGLHKSNYRKTYSAGYRTTKKVVNDN